MLSLARHVGRSSLSLRAAARRPAGLNVLFTGMGPNRLALRTLISEFCFLQESCNKGLFNEGVYGAPLFLSLPTAVKKYTEDHEAVAFDDSTGTGVISITDYAQESLGDVVFVELPALETKVTKGGQQSPRSPGTSPDI